MDIAAKIVESTLEIFTSMIMMDVVADPVELEDTGVLKNTITGIIGLAGTHKGILAIHLPYKVAMAITSSFLMMDIEEINPDVHDAVGELANILGGNVKTILSANGRDIDLSLPSTIFGEEYGFQPTQDIDKVLQQFKCEHGTFIVELQLEK